MKESQCGVRLYVTYFVLGSERDAKEMPNCPGYLIGNRVFSYLELITNWQFAQIFLTIKKFRHFCWDLSPQPLAYEARTIPQDHEGRQV